MINTIKLDRFEILKISDVWQRSAFPLTNYDCRTQPPSVDPVDPLDRPKFSLFSYIFYFFSSELPLLSSKHNCSFWHFAAFDNRSEPAQCCLTLVQRTPPQSQGSGWVFCPKFAPSNMNPILSTINDNTPPLEILGRCEVDIIKYNCLE